MKFDQEKKKAIITYILEKINDGTTSLSNVVSKNLDINQSTVHAYLNELIEKGYIKKTKRDTFELCEEEYIYRLKRSNGDLDDDIYIYNDYVDKHLNNLPLNVQKIWQYVFCEMANNVMDHSEAENATIIVKKNILNTLIILSDDGVGIFKKIKEYFGLKNLDEAITELFKGKLTTDSKNHSGEGIFFSSKMMDVFFVVSDGKVFSKDRYEDSSIMDVDGVDYLNTSGTHVFMSLSNNSKKTTVEVFDRFADVDNGFTKTIIPLKNIFDSSPVSRSQAKRLCNNLDKFETVYFDFEDMDWMGQGFAHQIFVVFANENPDIKLVPVNMSQDVEKMYKHVINSK